MKTNLAIFSLLLVAACGEPETVATGRLCPWPWDLTVRAAADRLSATVECGPQDPLGEGSWGETLPCSDPSFSATMATANGGVLEVDCPQSPTPTPGRGYTPIRHLCQPVEGGLTITASCP